MLRGRIPLLAGAARAMLARHGAFAAALAAGVALRAVAELGYRWAIWFNDSFDYLAIALRLRPDPMRPIGYPALLWLLEPLHSFAAVTTLQHLLGLGTAVVMYALLRARLAVPGWAATLAAAPVLFDAYQIQLEHLLLSDTLFVFLAVAAMATLCWVPAARPRPVSPWRAVLAGTLLAVAVTTRPVGVALIVIAIGYLLVCGTRWRTVAAACAAALAPLAGYAWWFHATYGQFALGSTDGIFLWGRTAAFADCRTIKPPPQEAWLCPRLPVALRAASSSQVWQATSPFHWQHGHVFSAAENDLAFRFALRAIAAQPGSYARTVLTGAGRAFEWDRRPYPTAYTARLYTFSGAKTWLPTWLEPDGRSAAAVARAYTDGHAATVTVAPYDHVMRWYQRYFYLRGPLLAIILVLPPAAGLAAAPRRARRRRGGARDAPATAGEERDGDGELMAAQRRAAWLCWAAAVALLVLPPAATDFDYRYVLPVVPFSCLAAALTAQRLLAGPGGFHPRFRPAARAKAVAASIRTVHELTRADG